MGLADRWSWTLGRFQNFPEPSCFMRKMGLIVVPLHMLWSKALDKCPDSTAR